MKLVRYGPKGQEKPGIVDADGVVRDLSNLVDDIAGDVLTDQGLACIADADLSSLPYVEVDRYGPCVGGVGKFICIGLNYSDHATESGLEVPREPVIFAKATSAICGPNDTVEMPIGSKATDWEVELGVVIGKEAKYIDEAEALKHVAGYCVINDISERDFQNKRAGQWTKGKSADTFGPIGPWLVTRDEVPNPQDLTMYLDVNGKRRQDGKHQHNGVQRSSPRLLPFPIHEPSARRHYLNRHPSWCWHGESSPSPFPSRKATGWSWASKVWAYSTRASRQQSKGHSDGKPSCSCNRRCTRNRLGRG
jgi:ureidoglycolate lyase